MEEQMSAPSEVRRRSSVKGQNVVLTGGSAGIGRTTAETFVADGANVTFCSRDREEIEETATTINEMDYPGQAHGVKADVTNPADIEHLHEAATDRFGQVDTLINNVGGASGSSHLDEMEPDIWKYIIKLNLFSTYYVTREFANSIKNSGGSVVNISSFVSQFGVSGMGAYAPAKSGINALTRTLGRCLDKDEG
jgi:NAD(P)-dependent dehydrogenase (short-subunit alcohol dehydrogenase family)